MCMFSGLSPIHTTLFFAVIGLMLFGFPIKDFIQRKKSPLRVRYSFSLSIDDTTHQSSSRATLHLSNNTKKALGISRIGVISKQNSQEDTLSDESITWLTQNIKDASFPLILRPAEVLFLQFHENTPVPARDSIWVFEIDGVFYRTDPHCPEAVVQAFFTAAQT